MTGKNLKVDAFIAKTDKWRQEFIKLREIALASGMTEDLKWGVPCYTVQGSNVILIHGFKEYCAILFVKGALLKDLNGILVQQTANVQSARQVRFTSVEQIIKLETVLMDYIKEAIAAERAGLKVDFKPTAEFNIPEELKTKLDADPALKTAFEKLTPGRQRAYLLHFSQPKQSATRTARVEKCIPLIMAGKGLND